MTTRKWPFAILVSVLATGASTLRAEETAPLPGFRELLADLPKEIEDLARLHPLPAPIPAPRISMAQPCGWEEGFAPREEWTDSSDHWREALGTVVVCGAIRLLENAFRER